MRSRDVVLVGGAGSVGQVLIDKLIGHRVWIVDRAGREARAPSPDEGRVIQCELNDPTHLAELSRALPSTFSTVFLAASLENPTEPAAIAGLLNDNVASVGRFVATLGKRIDHFLYVSSISVYGVPKKNPIDEDDPIAPTTLYGVSKAAAELLAQVLCGQHKIPLTIVRAAQLFGLRSAQHTLPHILADRLSRKEDVKMFGQPDIVRDYLHVSDACDLFAAMVARPCPSVYNAGSGDGVSLLQLFQAAFYAFGKPFDFDPTHETRVRTESFSQLLKIDKVDREFGFSPKLPVRVWLREQAASVTLD